MSTQQANLPGVQSYLFRQLHLREKPSCDDMMLAEATARQSLQIGLLIQ